MPENWPAIKTPSYGSSTGLTKPALRSKSEAGYTQTRKRFTLAKEKRSLTWDNLTNADFATLKTFFDTNQGGSFYWTDPETSVTKEYFFADDVLDFKYSGYGHKSGTVNIEEV